MRQSDVPGASLLKKQCKDINSRLEERISRCQVNSSERLSTVAVDRKTYHGTIWTILGLRGESRIERHIIEYNTSPRVET